MKVSRGILSVCLLFQAVQTVMGKGHDTGKLNDITFECSKGFSFFNGNCYKAIDVPQTMGDAYASCLGQGSLPYYPEDEIEYHEYVAKLLPKTIWFGLLKDSMDDEWKILRSSVPLEKIPRWGNGQPDLMDGNATAVDPVKEVMIYDGNKKLPFVCKYQACLEDYMPCDAKCIPQTQVCNGLPECLDERDENNCPSRGTSYERLSQTSGSIQTKQLSDFDEQTWILEAQVGDRIRLNIPQMNLEQNVVFLEVWTGSSLFHYSDMLGRFTGSVSSKKLYSKNNFMSIRFYAKDIMRSVGTYSFEWVTNIPNIPGKTMEETAISTWKSIMIPFTGEEYRPDNLKLSWLISANDGQVVTYFVRISPKSGYSIGDVKYELMADGMEIHDRHYYTSATKQVNLMSNFVPVNGGVTLYYKLGCGMTIDDTYGVIVSPHPVPNDLQCSWTLNAGETASRGMALKFMTLSLKGDSRTNPEVKSEDKFMIYVDKSSEEITEVSLYNDDKKNIIHAPKGHFKVDFISDSAFMSEGFKIGFGTDCDGLEVSDETEKDTNMTYFQEDVILSCPTGYKFHMEKYHNDETVTLGCQPTSYGDKNGPGMWTIGGKIPGAIPECQEVYCGPPNKIQNGGIKYASGVTYKKVATYFCNGGFEMKPDPKQPNATCEENGFWSDVPTCTSSQCAALPSNILANGKFEITRGNDFTNNNADFDTIVEFSCDPGYELMGPKISHCDSDGWTHQNNQPSCKKISCAVPQIENSNVPITGPTSPTSYDSTYDVSCNDGFEFRSGEAGTVSLKCQSNGTFDKTLFCDDTDECKGANLCNTDTTVCENTVGNYICKCKPGYTRDTDIACKDVRECDIKNGGCSDTCTEQQGSYKCECPTGKSLIESNGFEGFNFPSGETGLREGDIFYINHTCVAKQCPKLETVANGIYLSPKSENFHFEDEVTLQCMDGYQITGTSLTSAVSKCSNDGTWDKLNTCEARKCNLPSVPTNGEYDKKEVNFGERLKLTCKLTNDDNDKKELSAVCIYVDKVKGLGFAGDDITKCPEINCGDPESVMPSGGKYLNNVGPTTTTFLSAQSKFTFDCEDGYDVIGSSGDDEGTNVVKCKDNGRWNFGTLACAGKMCKDPGTLGDSKQVFNGYDIGSELYYSCVRTGFTVPDKKYTCQFIGGNAVWSDNLKDNVPECKDTSKPTFSGDCGETKYVDAVDIVSFNTISASDNFRLASMTMTDNIQTGLDRITGDTTVTYTARDFEGNQETCSLKIEVIDRTDKPTLDCPDFKTVQVNSRDLVTYDYKDDVTVNNGDITSVTPSNIVSSVNRIGTMEIVTVTARNKFQTESMCTYMVYFEAGSCFEEELFTDSNAERDCFTQGNNLVCNSTCKAGYMYSDKKTEKQFTCTGSNNWNDNETPHNRFCLRQSNPAYDVPVVVEHEINFLSGLCLSQFTAAITADINNFESRINQLCQQQWDVSVESSVTGSNSNSVYQTKMKLTLVSSVSVSAANDCIEKVKDNENGVFVVNNNILSCQGASQTLTVKSVAASPGTKNCETGYYLDGDICLQYGPAQYFDVGSNSEKTCPDGQYQDGLAQTGCKECPSGQFPNSDKTRCQNTCPAGFYSDNGFYPCTPCAANTYWTAKDKCEDCESGHSTVGIEGAKDESKCYAQCPKGQYSRTGYDVAGCTSCPVNFYQDELGQRTCKECGDKQVTATTGSNHIDNCTQITDTCNREYCNDHGECSFKRHRRLCTCDPNTGYYGSTCQNMYHICDGNPCKNGGTCVRGDTYTDYTCTCKTDLDKCEMKTANEALVGKSNDAYDARQRNLEQCKAACVADSKCKQASFTMLGSSGFCLLFDRILLSTELIGESTEADVHMTKECFIAYGGDRCEKDTKDDCEGHDCNENSQCKNNINGFQCICPSNGGFSGDKCRDPNKPCESNPCVHGTCAAYGSVRFECTCFDGYYGVRCENNTDDCANNPNACAYGGSCMDQVGNYRCDCKAGFGGTNCENTPNFCADSDCKGDNVCYNSIDTMEGVCVCDTALFQTRYRCEMVVTNGKALQTGELVTSRTVRDIEGCKTECQNNYKCWKAIFDSEQSDNCKMYGATFSSTSSGTETSFEISKNCNKKPDVGYACDQVRLPCEDVDCNNGECENINGNLESRCICNDGYTGSLCQHSVDDCINHQCQNGAECVDDHNKYNCSCKDGFEGNRCQTNIDECVDSPCNTTYGTCKDGVNGYECICNDGYVGENCDMNFKDCSSYPCQHGGECVDGVNSFECVCKDGYTGNMCENMKDNCAGQRTCENGGECISLQETSFCRCEGGATGDRCENATLLCDTLSNTDVCINNGVCINKEGTADCECEIVYDTERCFMEKGMEGKSGGQLPSPKIPSRQTNSAEECLNRCLNDRDCAAVSYAVISETVKFCQFYVVGEEKIGEVAGSTHYRRNCPRDYKGVSCDIVRDWCSESPCQNGGKCMPLDPVGYKCECMPGYSGATCQNVADPCSNSPCFGRADCRATSLLTYECLCTQGRPWTGTSCRSSSTDYTMLVNAADQRKRPASLQTLFHLKTNELSIMMRVRVHDKNEAVTLGTIFALLVTKDVKLPENMMFDYSLTVNKDGIYLKDGMKPVPYGISFENEKIFGNTLFDGEWHHLGISLTSNGMLSASIDSFHVEDPVDTKITEVDFDHNAQINLGYGHIIEVQDVEVYDKFFETSVFSQASTGKKPDVAPIQSFRNYNLPPSTSISANELGSNIAKNPYMDIPTLKCDDVEDIYYASSERLVSISAIPNLLQKYETVKQSSGSSLEYKQTVESTVTWGVYPFMIIGMDKATNNYGVCRSKVAIRYNAVCPSMDALFGTTVSYRKCSDSDGYCDIKCKENSKVFSAPIPYYIPCGTLGVYDYRMPVAETYYPECEDTEPVKYRLDAFMKYKLETECAQTASFALDSIDDKVRENFKVDVTKKWNDICEDENCSNLKDVEYYCDNDEKMDVVVKFSLLLTSMTLNSVTGGSVDIENALKLIIRTENLINLKAISGATLKGETVVINRVLECPTGNRLDMSSDSPVCVPCSKGYYLNDNGECKPCDYRFYTDKLAQTKCEECPDMKVTYRRGVRSSNECKEKCKTGTYYDEGQDKCVPCKRHFYQHEEGKNFCIPCGKEYKTVGEGSDSENDCKADCPAGEERIDEVSPCKICERGYWRSLAFDDCQKCPDKKTTFDNDHAKDVSDCKMDICELGSYFDKDNDMKCKQCPLGYYQDEKLALNCKKCDGNKTTRGVGSISGDSCEFFCPAGYEIKDDNQCVPCERGTYKDNVGLAKFEACKQCPQDTTDMMGATSSDNCTIPICKAGQFIEDGDCKNCQQDYFSNDELPTSKTICKKCPDSFGTEGTGSTADQCMRYCGQGTFLKGNICAVCPRGYYKDNAGSTRFDNCTKCPDKENKETTTDLVGSKTADDCSVYKCTAGYVSTETGCSPCKINTYQPIEFPLSTDECKPCQPKNGRITNTKTEGTTSSDGCLPICDAGKFFSTSSCVPCERGTYKENVGDARFGDCTECPDGKTTEDIGADDESLCSLPKCAAGKYLKDNVCTDCDPDFYSEVVNPNTQVKCLPCGTVQSVVYGTEQAGANNSTLCKPTCPGGKQYNADTKQCEDCPIESFKGDDGRFASCIACETVKPGYVASGTGSKTGTQCTVRNCQPGYRIDGSECKICPVKTYQDRPRQTECIPCGENLSTDGEGKTSQEDCQTKCGPGLEGTTSCKKCDAGKYKQDEGYELCQDCPIDRTSNEARTACDIYFCSVGKEYSNDENVESCKECQEGFFKSQRGNEAKCEKCPLGFTTNGTGQGSCNLLNCVPGKYKLGDECVECKVRTFKSVTGNEECQTCPDGSTTDKVTGATSSTQCDTVICDKGKYRKPDQKQGCFPCDTGYYQPDSGKTSCIKCPDDKITLQNGQFSEDACVPECKAGEQYDSDSETCFLCPTGTYKSTVGNTDTCTPCPAEKTTAGPGGKQESDCSQNKCPPGKYFEVEQDMIVCKECPIGKYSDKEMQDVCTVCPDKKTTQATGTKSADMCILDCSNGNGYLTNLAKCDKCLKGQYNGKEGKNPNTCKLCAEGKTNYQSGSTTCPFDVSPIPDNRIDLEVTTEVNVAINDCSDTDSINGITNQFVQQTQSVFQKKTDERYNGKHKFCSGSNCENLESSPNPTCEVINRRKRALTHTLLIQLVFRNINEFITDTADDNVNIAAVEVISQIFRLNAAQLSDQVKEIIFKGYMNVTTQDICETGETLINSVCTPCSAGTFGSSPGVCEACPDNTYQDLIGQKDCKQCPDKTYTENKGSAAASQCIPICQAGNEFNADTKNCSMCELGYYKTAEGNQESCTKCSADKTTKNKGSTSPDDCSEIVCQAGEYYYTDEISDEIKCRPCAVGTYNENIMAAKCVECSSSQTTQGTGKKSKEDCIDKCATGNGYDIATKKCTICPEGQYNDGSDPYPNNCKYCPDGQKSSAGSSQCIPDTVPTIVKIVIIRVPLTFSIAISSCDDTGTLNSYLTRLSLNLRKIYINARRNFNKARSFCTNEDCENLNLNFAGNNPNSACSLRVAGRRKRQAGLSHTIDVVAEFKNVSDRTEDSNTGASLPTAGLVSQILDDNKDSLTTDISQIQFDGAEAATETVTCDPGKHAINNQCVDCGSGRYSDTGETCKLCPTDTYQNMGGQSSCKSCPPRTYNDETGATEESKCLSYCVSNPNYCNNRGVCSDSGRRSASCSCYDNYEGATCASKKEPTSDMPVILGGAIGGGAALLIIILIIVGVFMKCSRDSAAKERKHKQFHDPEYIHNSAYEGTYDNYGYHGGQVRPIAPYPAIGYPALGYKPDQSFEEEGTFGNAYKYRPSINGDDMRPRDDEARFVWSA